MLMFENDMTEDPGRAPSMGCKVLTQAETRSQVGGRRDFKTRILRISITYECFQFVIHCGRISYALSPQTHKINPYISVFMGLPDGSGGKESAFKAGDTNSIPGSGKSSGGGNGNPLLCSCLKNKSHR